MDAAKGESFVLRQTHFSEQRYATAWKYIDLWSSAVRQFSESEQLPEDGQIRPKRVASEVILMSF
jgi:hypothetical protein